MIGKNTGNSAGSKRLRIAVIGGGHLGTIHARLLRRVPNAELVAIVEPSEERAITLAQEFECEIETNVERFLNQAIIDGAVIAAPTTLHHSVGMTLLGRGVHCLVEKPLASSTSECQDLVAAARRSGCVLQVGHVERFNPAWTTFRDREGEARFIDARREGTLSFRSMDAGVVLDLMIHDIDLVLSLVNAPVTSIEATGFNWTGTAEDIAHAQIRFANGCVARLSASRVSSEPQRTMSVYGDDWSADVDFAARKCRIVRGPRQRDWQSRSYAPEERTRLMESLFDEVLEKRELAIPEGNAILDELIDFTTSITTETSPIVSGRDGLQAVDVASQIIRQIKNDASPDFGYRKAG